MASEKKLPWRTLQMGGDTGRFTREQLDAAVLAVKAERDQSARPEQQAGLGTRAGK